MALNGFDPLRVCSQMRTHERTRSLPILLVAEDADRARVVRARRHRVDALREAGRFGVRQRRHALLRGRRIDAHRLQAALHVAAAQVLEDGRAVGLRRSGDDDLVGADHSGCRDVVRRPDHQRDQQTADCSCPNGFHFSS